MAKSLKSNSRLRVQLFEARLERLRSRLRWVVVFIGFDAYGVWGLRGRIRVKGQINGFSFRTSLFPSRGIRHFLLVNKGMQKGGAVREGDLAQIMLEPDFEQRIAQIPSQLAGILKAERSLEGWYGKLNDSTRADIASGLGSQRVKKLKCGAPTRLRNVFMQSWKARRNCLRSCAMLSLNARVPGKVGTVCRCLVAAASFLLSNSRSAGEVHRQSDGCSRIISRKKAQEVIFGSTQYELRSKCRECGG